MYTTECKVYLIHKMLIIITIILWERGIIVDSIKNREVRAAGLNKSINQFLNKLKNNFAANEISEDEKFLEQLNQAHEEWQNAELYFQSVTEPDLIDYAIYKMEASRTKYFYLLKQAREMGIKAENVSNSL